MTKKDHKRQIVYMLQEILAKPNARSAAQRKLYEVRASLLTRTQRG